MTPNPTSEPDQAEEVADVVEDPTPPDVAPDETTAVPAGETTPIAANETTPIAADETTPVTADETPAVEPVPAEPIFADTTAIAATPVAPAEPTEPAEPTPAEVLEQGPTEVVVVTPAGTDPEPAPGTVAAALIGVTLLFALLIAAFALPAIHSGPKEVPIGVAGSAQVVPQLKQLFAEYGKATYKDDKTFKVTTYASEAKLRQALKDHKEYGGLTVTQSSTATSATMLLSSAASPATATELVSIASQLSQQSQFPVADVVPLPKKDRLGNGLAALALPLALGSLLPAGFLFVLYRRRAASQLLGTVAGSIVIGLVLSAILTFWLGSTKGANYPELTLAIAFGVAAISLFVLGLGAVAGRIGLAVGAAIVVLFSAPLAGLANGPYFLPSPWGTIGQLLPVGALGTVLRSVAYFHGHGAGAGLLVLLGWALIGGVLLVLGTALITDPAADDVVTDEDLAELGSPQPVS